jgi:glycosyltransferase involved in cell wall biosynthesis
MRFVVAIFEQLVPISGGGTPRTWHIVHALSKRGHEVHVAAAFGVDKVTAQSQLGCADILALRHVSRLDSRKMLKYLFVYPWNVLRLALYVWQVKPDVIVSHNTVAAFGALLGRTLSPGTIAVLDLTDLLFEYLESYSSMWMRMALALGRAIEHYAIGNSQRIITISEAMRTILVQNHGVDHRKVDIIHDGVDCSLFEPRAAQALRRQISPQSQHICILHGVIDPQDDPMVLVQAAPEVLARFPDTAFWWVGDGAAVPKLKQRATTLGLAGRFYFSGWIQQNQVTDYINASDLGIVVLPDVLSARGRVTLKEFEYWACGKPAVLPRLPALQEIVPDGVASLFFTPGDPDDLAEKICTLLADDAQRQQMGLNGRRMVVEHFDWPVLTEQLAELCETYASAAHTGRTVPAPLGGDE